MRIGLFVPCYIDQLYPQVAVASLEILEKLGYEVGVPDGQTCCGQPMANSGYEEYSKKSMQLFVEQFSSYDYIVAPSGSCVYHVRKHFDNMPQSREVQDVRKNTLDIGEFLLQQGQVKALDAYFPYKVGLHQSCHGLRGLQLGKASELVGKPFSLAEELLGQVDGIELVQLERPDECCGFGGTFAIAEEAVSVKMGMDRVQDHLRHGAEVITGTDMSCLMHLEGIIRRNKLPLRVMHLVEILIHSKN
jgi:L-lactate dehydrogenase complex protein LldE